MIGLVILSTGVVLVLFAAHEKGLLPVKHPGASVVTASPVSPTEKIPVVSTFAKSSGDCHSSFFLLGGALLCLFGGGIAIRYR